LKRIFECCLSPQISSKSPVLKETEHRKREREKVLKKVRKSIEREREKEKGKERKRKAPRVSLKDRRRRPEEV
jgi:hypothetical protein